MKHIFLHMDEVRKKLAAKDLAVFLDFDGTLSPIAPTPGSAHLPPGTKRLIEMLSAAKGVMAAIISGRSLKDVSARVGIRDIIYAGNHGMEISGKGIEMRSSPAGDKDMKELKAAVLKAVRGIDGARVEDKGASLTVHYRLSPKAAAAELRHRMVHLRGSLGKGGKFYIRRGKKAYEILPVGGWNKGMAIIYILEKLKRSGMGDGYSVVYMGDDRTDRDAFKAVRGDGISVYVGKSRTGYGAEYYLRNTLEAAKFLEYILKLRKEDL